MSLIIGVDPGLKGALASVDSYGELVDVFDMPVLGKLVSVQLLLDGIGGLACDDDPLVVIENVFSSPGWGHSMAFNFGRSKGAVEGVAAGMGYRLAYVTPAQWKREMGLSRDKDAARAMAVREWPRKADLFKRVKDDGRAEAALIALWKVRHGS